MSLPKCQYYLGFWLLLTSLWCGACTGSREHTEARSAPQSGHLQGQPQYDGATYQRAIPPHHFDKTETDLEQGRPEPALRYHRPQGMQTYHYDKTEADLSKPGAVSSQAKPQPHGSPATDTVPQTPLPDGGR